jgi:hypothetical protein
VRFDSPTLGRTGVPAAKAVGYFLSLCCKFPKM